MLVWIGGKLLYAILFRKTALDTPAAPVASLRHSFRDGLAIALFNPKIATFFASLFSQFITPEQSIFTHLGMAGMAGFIDSSIYILMVFLASTKTSQSWLDRYQKQIDVSFSVLLLGLGFSLIFSQINQLL